MEEFSEQAVKKIVAEDFRTSAAFEYYKIDYFNRGGRSLMEVADEEEIDLEELIRKIKETKEGKLAPDFDSWPLDRLTDYIIEHHHHYAEEKGPVIQSLLETLLGDYKELHPELDKIKRTFDFVFGQIAVHQKKEELILFPYIRKMVESVRDHTAFVRPMMTKSAERPVDMLTHEHRDQGEAFEKIVAASRDYTVPEDMEDDFTYEDAFNTLKAFEQNLHKHLHLENNILFPKALKMDQEL